MFRYCATIVFRPRPARGFFFGLSHVGDDLTDFGIFCEANNIPVFDRAEMYLLWQNRLALIKEIEAKRRAEESGYKRRGRSRKNVF